MSIASIAHPPDRLFAPPVSSRTSLDQLITAEVVGDLTIITRITARLVQCCIERAQVNLEQECVQWEREIPQDVAIALGLPRDSCNAISMADALLSIGDLEDRKKILAQIICVIAGLA